jgi:integrase
MTEPYLWKHADYGIYYVIWMANINGQPTQKRKSLKTKDRRKARRKLNDFKRDLIAGKIVSLPKSGRVKFFDFCDEFRRIHEPKVRSSTWELYEEAIKKAKACWGNVPIFTLNKKSVELLMADMARAGLKVPTVNKNYRHIRTVLGRMFEWEYISRPIRLPGQWDEEKLSRFLTISQLRLLIGEMDDLEFSDFCLMSAYTGLRSGELCRLPISDVDNPKGFIRVDARQKSKKDDRIPITKNVRVILGRCMARAKAAGRPTIFRRMTTDYVTHKFKKYVRSAKLPDHIRFHDMRHTYGSYLAMEGHGEKSIQELMRHASIESTLVYTNVSPEHLRKVAETIDYGPMPVGKESPEK